MRRYLVDTSVFLWSLGAPAKLNRQARQLLQDRGNEMFLSAASVWELSVKSRAGKLRLPEPPSTYIPKRLASAGFRALAITHLHALKAGELPAHHQDPFDRMLIAQAGVEGFALMTADRLLEKYDVEIVWCGT